MAETTKYRAEGARLKSARRLLGKTQDGLAELIGSSLAAVKSWERGNSRPNRDLAAKLAGLGINMDYVESGEGEPLIPKGRLAAWGRIVDSASQPDTHIAREPMAQLRTSTDALEALCGQLGFTPPAHWMVLVQELMVLDGLGERGARRLLETLKEDERRAS